MDALLCHTFVTERFLSFASIHIKVNIHFKSITNLGGAHIKSLRLDNAFRVYTLSINLPFYICVYSKLGRKKIKFKEMTFT